MELISLKSRRLKPNDDLLAALKKAFGKRKLKEGDILVIASKAVAYSQGRLVLVKSKKEFRKLIEKEADAVLDEGEMVITLKNHILIPNAGIDNSNTPKNTVVLWPDKPFKAAQKIRQKLIKNYKIKNLGIVISDSHCQPLRAGTSGIAIGWAGFMGVQDERGNKDLFGKKMEYTQIAVADDLASSANLLMGETNASIPFVIARGLKVKWSEKKFSEKDYFIHPKECIYKHFYSKKLLNT
ncbi:coenzyme F420-0:L-glutamate ligase [Patescibacteria group bacterium]|nr:coenzyme F420-0:L-glutamate ligase [Patescibacteria group bacterium]